MLWGSRVRISVSVLGSVEQGYMHFLPAADVAD